MRVLFLALSYSDVQKESNLYSDLVEELVALGLRVKVVAPASDASQVGERIEGGTQVLRVQCGALFNTNTLTKGLNNVLLPLRYFLALRGYLKSWKPDWVMISTPPVTLSPLVWWISRRCSARVYLVLRDIFPQNALDLGLMSWWNPVYWFFRVLERLLYRCASDIGCMSPANCQYVLMHNQMVRSSTLHLLPNWIAERHISDQTRPMNMRAQWGAVEQDLLCVFGGNLGRPQSPNFLLDAARRVEGNPRIRFVIVGTGTESQQLKKRIEAENLPNIIMRDRLPRDEYQQLIATADLGIILLNSHFTIPNIPSRLMGYWAAGLPVLAATDTATDLNEAFLAKYSGGRWVTMGDVEGFVEQLSWFADHREQARRMGLNGQRAVRQHFTARIAAETIRDRMLAPIN